MYADYINWQFVQGPRWLLQLLWNLQKMFFHAFSVTFMLKTLLAHWHKDAFSYGGGLENMALTFIWNQVSRTIGLIIRSTVLATWLVIVALTIPLSVGALIAFITWPLWIVIMFATGFSLTIM